MKLRLAVTNTIKSVTVIAGLLICSLSYGASTDFFQFKFLPSGYIFRFVSADTSGGYVFGASEGEKSGLVKLNSKGRPAVKWGDMGQKHILGSLRDVLATETGKTFLLYDQESGKGYLRTRITVLSEDGTTDETFAGNGYLGLDQIVDPSSLTLDSQGRILFTARKESRVIDSRSSFSTYLFRFLPNGQPDKSFNGSGRVTVSHGKYGNPLRLKLDTQNRLWVVSQEENNLFVSRFLENGSPDLAFWETGHLKIDTTAYKIIPEGVLVDQDDLIVIRQLRGWTSTARIKSDGTISDLHTFQLDLDIDLRSTALGVDGSVYLSGKASSSDLASGFIAKLDHVTLLPDSSFKNSGIWFPKSLRGLEVNELEFIEKNGQLYFLLAGTTDRLWGQETRNFIGTILAPSN